MKRPFASLLGILFVTGSMASPLSQLRELGQLDDSLDMDRYERRGVEREYNRRSTDEARARREYEEARARREYEEAHARREYEARARREYELRRGEDRARYPAEPYPNWRYQYEHPTPP